METLGVEPGEEVVTMALKDVLGPCPLLLPDCCEVRSFAL